MEETWPASAGFKFCIGFEEGEIATDAAVCSGFFIGEVSTAECGFGSFCSEDFVLLGSELSFPFGIGFHNFVFSVRGFVGDFDSTDRGDFVGVLRIAWILGVKGQVTESDGCGDAGNGDKCDLHTLYNA